MLEVFAHVATDAWRPYIPIWINGLADIKQDYLNSKHDKQLLSALEMVTSKHKGATLDNVVKTLELFSFENIPRTSYKQLICEKPCESYEGDEPYVFISYANYDAQIIYPIIKELYECGWDLWYDEGIRINEYFLPVIAHRIKCCSVFVIMLTNQSLDRPFVMNYELEYARLLGIPIIPVIMEELDSKPWSINNMTLLLQSAISPHSLLECITASGINNRGTRSAISPAIKSNVIYDVVLPPKLSDFTISVTQSTITITAYHGSDTNVVIPSKIVTPDASAEFRVTAIGDYAFSSNKTLRSLTLPFGITRIGEFAFAHCELLSTVEIPDGVLSIGNFAFAYCKLIEHVNIPDSVTVFGVGVFHGTSLDGVDAYRNADSYKNTLEFESKATDINLTLPIPQCKELPRALVCCSDDDIGSIVAWMAELYWEGFNIHYENVLNQQMIEDFQCILAFFSEHTSKSKQMINLLMRANESRIVQVFLGDCTQYPNEIREKLQYRQSIVQSQCSEREFWGRIRDSLRQFGCYLNHPRGFEVSNFDDEDLRQFVTIKKFRPTGFQQVIIPKTFFDPPLKTMSISQGAFKECKLVSIVIIPPGLIRIGKEAFIGCKSLVFVNIPDSVTRLQERTFFYCVSLEEVDISKNLEIIEDSVFFGCRSLKSIALPNSVTNIGSKAFCACSSLTSINIPNSVQIISNGVLSGCSSLESINIPEGVTSIGDEAFYDCISITDIAIPASVTSIGRNAFANCKSLVSISLPNAFSSIGDDAFKNTPLENLIYRSISTDTTRSSEIVSFSVCDQEQNKGSSVTGSFDAVNMGDYIEIRQYNPEGSSNVTIPNTLFDPPLPVESIARSAFFNCASLTSITLPDNLVYIGHSAFAFCSSLTRIVIPNSVKYIEEGAFSNCTSLRRVILSNSLKEINNTVFSDCDSLTEIVIPDSVELIDSVAFVNCISLESIDIPKSVRRINSGAFGGCISLRKAVIPDNDIYIDQSAFGGCEFLTVYIRPTTSDTDKAVKLTQNHSDNKLIQINDEDDDNSSQKGFNMKTVDEYSRAIAELENLLNEGRPCDVHQLASEYLGRSLIVMGSGDFPGGFNDMKSALRIQKRVFSDYPQYQEGYFTVLGTLLAMDRSPDSTKQIKAEFLDPMIPLPKTDDADATMQKILADI